jgi:hypothetical protein
VALFFLVATSAAAAAASFDALLPQPWVLGIYV